MKACFYLQRRFAYIGHELICIIKERYGIKDFCGYVETRSSLDFLKSQKDISYTGFLLDEEIIAGYKDETLDLNYLRELEERYGLPSLWPHILRDRVIRYNLMVRSYPRDASRYSHEDIMRMLQVSARAIEKFLDKEKPDFVFFSVVTGLGSSLLYQIAKARGIKTICLYHPRLGERYALTFDYHDYRSLHDAAAIHMSDPASKPYIEKAEAYLKEFQAKPSYYLKQSSVAHFFINTPITRSEHFRFLNPKRIFKSFWWFCKSHLDYFKNPYKSDYTTIRPWHEAFDKARRKFRTLIDYRNLYDEINEGAPYAYFSLQSEPEGLPMLLAPFYFGDQLWLVKQAAQSIPFNFKLYVKDHPVMVGRRARKFYKDLKKIPNVVLIKPEVSGLELISKSKLVFAITGTAGMEAVLLKKSSIVFGDSFYSKWPGVMRCRSVEDLSNLVFEALNKFEYKEQELLRFMAAVYKESVPIDLTKIWDVEGGSTIREKKGELLPLADLIAAKLGLKPINLR